MTIREVVKKAGRDAWPAIKIMWLFVKLVLYVCTLGIAFKFTREDLHFINDMNEVAERQRYERDISRGLWLLEREAHGANH